MMKKQGAAVTCHLILKHTKKFLKKCKGSNIDISFLYVTYEF